MRRRPFRRPRWDANQPPPPRCRRRGTGSSACGAPSLRRTTGWGDAPTARASPTRTDGTRARAGLLPERATAPAPTAAPRRLVRAGPVERTIARMIHDVDKLLERLVKKDALNGSSVELVFEAPTKDWVARRSGPAVDLYLYDIREDLERRVPAWEDQKDGKRRDDRPAAAAATLPPGVPRHGLDPATGGRAPPAVGAAVVLHPQRDAQARRARRHARRAEPARLHRRRPAAVAGPLARRRLVGAGRRAEAVARRHRHRADGRQPDARPTARRSSSGRRSASRPPAAPTRSSPAAGAPAGGAGRTCRSGRCPRRRSRRRDKDDQPGVRLRVRGLRAG